MDYNFIYNVNNKSFFRHLRKVKLMKIKFKIISYLGIHKVNYLRKNKIFREIGTNVLYQPDTLPNNPQLIKIHNNVWIASKVIFYEHDVINAVFQNLDKNVTYIDHMGCIEIFDNCFIGGNSIILSNVKIGPNAIVGAGSVVTKDVPEGTIVAGNPAKVIGKFENLHEIRKNNDTQFDNCVCEEIYNKLWDNFYKKKVIMYGNI